MRATQNSQEDQKYSKLIIVIGLVGDCEEHRKITGGQVLKTIDMLLRFGNMPIGRGGRKTHCVIPGLEDVPMPSAKQEILVYNLTLDESKTKPKNVVSSEPGDSNSQDYNSVVIHICDHHTPHGGFRAGGDRFYDTEGIAKALVEIISNYKFENLHVVLHSCKTAVKSCPENDSTMQKLLDALFSELNKEEQKSPLSIFIYGVKHKISENSSGSTPFQLYETKPNLTLQQITGGKFERLTIERLTKKSAESAESEGIGGAEATPLEARGMEERQL